MDNLIRVKQNRLWAILCFVLFANIFFYRAFGEVAFGLITTGLWLMILKTFGNRENQKVGIVSSGIIALALSLLMWVDSNEKIVLLIFLILATFIISTFCFLKRDRVGGLFELGLSGVMVGWEYIKSAIMVVANIIEGKIQETFGISKISLLNRPWIKSFFIGVIFGIPIIIWLTSTLSHADPIFNDFIRQLVRQDFFDNLTNRLWYSLLIFVILSPLLLMNDVSYTSPLAWIGRRNWVREMTVISAMIAVVMGIFLIVQWPYVFATVAREVDLSKYGVATYSEYVNRGFSDLLKVVIFSFGVAWAGLILGRSQMGKERKMLAYVQGILGIEFMVFLTSIFRRVWLYQSYHGLSLARLYGIAIVIFILGMTVTIVGRYISRRMHWVQIEIGWMIVMTVVVVGVNMEKLVVNNPPTVNGRVDYVYLSRLSGDGYQGWIQAYQWANKTLSGVIKIDNIIEKETRRDVYYAGIILQNLTRNYHELTLEYATPDELREYIRQIALKQANRAGMLQDETASKEAERAIIDLANDNWYEKVGVVVNYRRYDGNLYYSISKGSKFPLSGIDKLLSYSPLRAKLYRDISRDIGVEKLLESQKLENVVSKRILLQPENERDFEHDISLESPFLQDY